MQKKRWQHLPCLLEGINLAGLSPSDLNLLIDSPLPEKLATLLPLPADETGLIEAPPAEKK